MFLLNRNPIYGFLFHRIGIAPWGKGSGIVLNGSEAVIADGNAEGSRDLEKSLAGGINLSQRGEEVLGAVNCRRRKQGLRCRALYASRVRFPLFCCTEGFSGLE